MAKKDCESRAKRILKSNCPGRATIKNHEDTGFKYVINRDKADELLDVCSDLEQRLDELKVIEKTVKKALKTIGKIASAMWEGDLIECHQKKSVSSMCY